MDSVGSENCVETATEQEYSHVQAVESFTPRKKLKQPDMSRTRWLGGGGSGGAAGGSLSLSLLGCVSQESSRPVAFMSRRS